MRENRQAKKAAKKENKQKEKAQVFESVKQVEPNSVINFGLRNNLISEDHEQTFQNIDSLNKMLSINIAEQMVLTNNLKLEVLRANKIPKQKHMVARMIKESELRNDMISFLVKNGIFDTNAALLLDIGHEINFVLFFQYLILKNFNLNDIPEDLFKKFVDPDAKIVYTIKRYESVAKKERLQDYSIVRIDDEKFMRKFFKGDY